MKIFDVHTDVLYDLYRKKISGEDNRIAFHNKQLKDTFIKGGLWTFYSSEDLDLKNAINIALGELKGLDLGNFDIILGFEGLRNLKSIEELDYYYNLGFRHAMLTWNEENDYATGAKADKNNGLKDLGKKVLDKMMSLGMIVDLAHLNEKSFFEVVEYVKNYDKIIYSHGLLKAFSSHPRNLTIKQLLALKQVNGLFGLTLANNFVSDDKDCMDLKHFMFHVREALEVIGEDNLCFGFDFMDYLSEFSNSNIKEVPDATKVYLIIEEMRKSGYSEKTIEKIAYGNFYEKYKGLVWRKING